MTAPSSKSKAPQSILWHSMLGILGLALGFGAFGYWAMFIPFEGAVILSGQVKAEKRNQLVQVLDGGILRDLAVSEGSNVKKGDILARLDDTEARTRRNRMLASKINLHAEIARLSAISTGANDIKVPELFKGRESEPAIRDALARQRAEFASRQREIKSEEAILDRRKAAVAQEQRGVEVELVSVREQLPLVADELSGMETLQRKKLARKDRLFSLRRSLSQMKAKEGELIAKLGQLDQRKSEIDTQKLKILHDARSKASKRLSAITRELAELAEQIAAAQDILNRTIIRAPSSGIVVIVSNQTPGGVLRPGESFIELLPLDQAQEIQAKLPATEVNNVRKGQQARLQFSAFAEQDLKPIPAKVSYVSADSEVDRQTGAILYQIRLQPDQAVLEDLKQKVMVPGSEVEIFITTPARTFAAYILEPLSNNLNRTFRDGR